MSDNTTMPDSNEVCRHYKELCEATGGADEYACTTCCKDFDSYGTYDDIMCIRQCLIDDDINKHNEGVSYGAMAVSRIIAHIDCYATCPGGITVIAMILKKGGPPDSCRDAGKFLFKDISRDPNGAVREIEDRFKNSCSDKVHKIEEHFKKSLSDFSDTVREIEDLFK